MAGWMSPDRETIEWDGTIKAKRFKKIGTDASDDFVNITGDTMTGNLEIDASNPVLTFDYSSMGVNGTVGYVQDNFGLTVFDGEFSGTLFMGSSSLQFTDSLLQTYTFQNGVMTASGMSTGNGTVELYPSGTYTPTLTGVANVAASTAYACQYMRVGNTVHVSGRLDIDPTTTLTLTQLGISLPIASNLGNLEHLAGTSAASTVTDNPAAIIGDTANNRAQLNYICVDVTNHSMFFTFMYQVI